VPPPRQPGDPSGRRQRQALHVTYHGWTFENDGRLTHIPGEQEAYYGAIDKSEMGLVEARVDVYAGIVFACWDKDAPSLEAWLGDARWYMDTTFNRAEHGMQAFGPQKWIENCNWKTPVDNCSDNYHVGISHYSSALAANKVFQLPMQTMDQVLKIENDNHHVFVNGHGLTFRIRDANAPRPIRRGVTTENRPIFEEWDQRSEEEAIKRLGFDRAKRLAMGNHSIFPNHVLGFRLALPRGPFKTEFWHFALVAKDAPDEVKHATENSSAQFNGASGIFEQDDMDNWCQVTEASKLTIGRKYPAVLSMGAGHAGKTEEWPGQVSERYISENNQRGYYQRWQEFMNADSWADIHVDPITVKFEGTAGFNS